jgi:hypothetical protein
MASEMRRAHHAPPERCRLGDVSLSAQSSPNAREHSSRSR